jgi:hypothetical protein
MGRGLFDLFYHHLPGRTEKKNIKTLSQNSKYSGRELNPGLPENWAEYELLNRIVCYVVSQTVRLTLDDDKENPHATG